MKKGPFYDFPAERVLINSYRSNICSPTVVVYHLNAPTTLSATTSRRVLLALLNSTSFYSNG